MCCSVYIHNNERVKLINQLTSYLIMSLYRGFYHDVMPNEGCSEYISSNAKKQYCMYVCVYVAMCLYKRLTKH